MTATIEEEKKEVVISSRINAIKNGIKGNNECEQRKVYDLIFRCCRGCIESPINATQTEIRKYNDIVYASGLKKSEKDMLMIPLTPTILF